MPLPLPRDFALLRLNETRYPIISHLHGERVCAFQVEEVGHFPQDNFVPVEQKGHVASRHRCGDDVGLVEHVFIPAIVFVCGVAFRLYCLGRNEVRARGQRLIVVFGACVV